MTQLEELARLGVATVHEAQGKTGLVDIPLVQVVPGLTCRGARPDGALRRTATT